MLVSTGCKYVIVLVELKYLKIESNYQKWNIVSALIQNDTLSLFYYRMQTKNIRSLISCFYCNHCVYTPRLQLSPTLQSII